MGEPAVKSPMANIPYLMDRSAVSVHIGSFMRPPIAVPAQRLPDAAMG